MGCQSSLDLGLVPEGLLETWVEPVLRKPRGKRCGGGWVAGGTERFIRVAPLRVTCQD